MNDLLTLHRNPLVASFMQRRGFTLDDLHYILEPDAAHQHDSFLLKGVGHWIDVLHSIKGLPVAIVPDYDADGVLSGTLARVSLYLFGFGDAYMHCPTIEDGYGLTRRSIDKVLAARPDIRVIITTDNGSNAHDGIQYAKSLGLVVLVTDHHKAGAAPPADAVVNPNGHGDKVYPFRAISGTAVIYKVMVAYARKYQCDNDTVANLQSLLLLVGISTISDVMPMVDENRYFVRTSVDMLSMFVATRTPERMTQYDDSPLGQYFRGVEVLVSVLDEKGRFKYGIDEDSFGFLIAPILNSPRRMLGESEIAFRLFSLRREDLPAEGHHSIGDELYELNEARKALLARLRTSLYRHVDTVVSVDGQSAVQSCVFNAVMGSGVAGLLAGSFSERYALPSIAFSVRGADENIGLIDVDVSAGDGYMMTGSARAPESFDLYGMLEAIDAAHPGLIGKWGGHKQAAGIQVHSTNYALFKQVFVTMLDSVLLTQGSTVDDGDKGFWTDCRNIGDFVVTTATYNRLAAGYGSLHADVYEVDVVSGENGIAYLWEAVRVFGDMSPYGAGFTKPVYHIVFSKDDVTRMFFMGAEKQHVKLMLLNGVSVIYWNGADFFEQEDGVMSDCRLFMATGEVSVNSYNGRDSLQMKVQDVQVIT